MSPLAVPISLPRLPTIPIMLPTDWSDHNCMSDVKRRKAQEAKRWKKIRRKQGRRA